MRRPLETAAAELCRWDQGLKMVGLRFCSVKGPADYPGFPALQDDARKQYLNFRSDIDARDDARAVVLAGDRQVEGLEIDLIASPDAVTERPAQDSSMQILPGVARCRAIACDEALLSTGKGRTQRGREPRHGRRAPA